MLSYSQGITKKEFVNEMKAHQKADQFLRGQYWDDSKGCAVGCGLHSISRIKKIEIDNFGAHKDFEKHLGWPEWFAELEDTVFENVSESRFKTWPVEIAEAIPEGVDLEKARVPIIVMLLEHTLESLDKCEFNRGANPDVVKVIDGSKAAVRQMIEAQKSGDQKRIDAAMSVATSAAESVAESVAMSVAMSVATSAIFVARSAIFAAMSAAESVARSAIFAAMSAAESVAESAAWYAARSAAFDYYADRILEILKELKQ